MNLLIVILGAFLQCCFALFSFMAVAFSAGVSGPSGILGVILDKAIIVIPVTSVCVAIGTIVLYRFGAGTSFYWLHAIPVLLLLAYFIGMLYLH